MTLPHFYPQPGALSSGELYISLMCFFLFQMQAVLQSVITFNWSAEAIASALFSGARQSFITEPICRFFELLQYGERSYIHLITNMSVIIEYHADGSSDMHASRCVLR